MPPKFLLILLYLSKILEKNENTNTVTETIKTKIEKDEAVPSEDFEEVFD